MNLGKLVPLKVHGRVRNVKIAKKNFSMLKWGVPYTVGKLKRRVSPECLGATPTTLGMGSCKVLQKHMYGGTSSSGGEKPLLVSLELAGKPLTRIINRKLDWVLGASTDVRVWIMSCPTPD